MNFFSFPKRFHESAACALLFAGAWTLHVMWVLHVLVARIPTVGNALSLMPAVGPVSGLYVCSLSSFALLFVGAFLKWRGKDCSHHRDHLVSFFLISTLLFFIMTLPFVYAFSVTIE